ncbi:LacI family DNA-binding transcriptional regulator [Streptomyces sp. WI04-05B]|uniref:LacI family DNA-binding transcriptional regulator n=1 Tax=Streptomyces TaxID=1883 RepID=UPI0029A37225|nr:MULTISPECIES: LacI family DNA-binding transcriptional regulator [unclassified Streptomyces]MDX2546533.1 LacI family DNA-binding transcriptional regulator [Streptomyces sp. WI04-05B]MDX2587835.1 LacI family DNA-binding transcriptional regulator [Streptomyces sp. WI04-05A]MDX3751567.1 LacI family DNA-binding transcriptional regulator [Streptomyces sp. AK08-02]
MAKRRLGAPTLEEVAARAGVGRGTVSRVINNAAGVKEATRRAVQRAVEDLGYVPNLAARSLAGRRADAVALVLTEPDWRQFAEPFFSEIVRSLGDALADTGMQLMLTLVRSETERQRFLEYARGGRVDGVLLMSVHGGDRLPDMLAEARLPTVMLGRRSGDEYVSYVDADNLGGARSAVSHLLKQGRTAIGTITGPLDMYVAQCRLRGYQGALEAAGLKGAGSLVAESDFTLEGGRRAMAELLLRHPEIDAVLAASDTSAAGALQALRAAGRRVPEDVAVIGFDDFPLAQSTEPRLTTVRQPVEEMGRAMIRLLLEEMEEASAAWRHVILRTELVVRESS